MGRTKPAKTQGKNKHFRRAHDLKRKVKDEDIIYEEYQTQKPHAIDVDLPGLGQFYCYSCSKHHGSQAALDAHYQSREHKKLLRRIRNEKPYTMEEAMAAGGQGSYRYNAKGLKPGEKTLGEKLAEAQAAQLSSMADNNAQVVLQPTTDATMQ